MRRKTWRLLGAIGVGVLLSDAARAEPPRPLSNEARAEQLFHSAEKKFDAGEYGTACLEFSESLKLGPKLGTLLNLALCHEMTNKLVTAWNEFSHAAAWAAQNNQKDRLEFATQHVRALEPRLPRIVLSLPTDRAIESIDLDGEPVPEQRWYLPLFLDTGEHRLAVSAPGKTRTSVAFRVTPSLGDQVVMVPSPVDEPKRPPPRPVTLRTTVDERRRTLGVAGLGIGAVGAVVGTIYGVRAGLADERDPAVRGYATAETVGFLGGLAFAAVGGWLFWTSKKTTLSAHALPQGAVLDGSF